MRVWIVFHIKRIEWSGLGGRGGIFAADVSYSQVGYILLKILFQPGENVHGIQLN
jgi:hypothetical protein